MDILDYKNFGMIGGNQYPSNDIDWTMASTTSKSTRDAHLKSLREYILNNIKFLTKIDDRGPILNKIDDFFNKGREFKVISNTFWNAMVSLPLQLTEGDVFDISEVEIGYELGPDMFPYPRHKFDYEETPSTKKYAYLTENGVYTYTVFTEELYNDYIRIMGEMLALEKEIMNMFGDTYSDSTIENIPAIIGCVFDNDGNPVSNVGVKIYYGFNGDELGIAYTDANGNYSFDTSSIMKSLDKHGYTKGNTYDLNSPVITWTDSNGVDRYNYEFIIKVDSLVNDAVLYDETNPEQSSFYGARNNRNEISTIDIIFNNVISADINIKFSTTPPTLSGITSVWDTTLGDGEPTITLPLVESGNYDFVVNWGDGTTDTITTWNQAEVTHTYSAGGEYTVIISGTIEGWSSNYSSDVTKLTSITNVGYIKLGNEASYFEGCTNLTTISGTFDLSGTTNFSNMFMNCSSLTNVQGIESWDVSGVTRMDGMFNGATLFNQDISGWDVSNITQMDGMFAYATAFNQDISPWNVSGILGSATKAIGMVDFMFGKSTADFSYYDNILNEWSQLSLPNNVSFGMGDIKYTTLGATARQNMIDTYGWIISDGGQYVEPFVSVWDTTLGDGEPTIILPLVNGGNYDFTVNWGDGTTDTITSWDQSEKTHTYESGGQYTVTISGTIEGWNFAMFSSNAAKITSITQWGVLRLTDDSVGTYFTYCTNLTLDTVSDVLNLSNITNLGYDFGGMFAYCTSLTTINRIDEWDVSNVTNMVRMFEGATSFNQDLSAWNISNVTNMQGFMYYKSTENYSYYDNLLNSWAQLPLNPNGYLDMGSIQYTLSGATARQNMIDTYGWLINDGGQYVEPFISVWDTNLSVTGIPSITLPLVESGNYDFTVNWGDGTTDTITSWDQSEKTHTYSDGHGIKTITIVGTIEGWVAGYSVDILALISITNVGCLKLGTENSYFNGCTNLTTISGTFDLSGIDNLGTMFRNCSSLTNVQGIESWDVSGVTYIDSMFDGATLFNQDISGWDVSNVLNMQNMFRNATSFNQPLNSWDVSSVTVMANMFKGATSFNQPLNSWDVSSVTQMGNMFNEAISFNQDISSWDISSIQGGSKYPPMAGFMAGKSTVNYSYYDNLLNAWSQLTLNTEIILDMGDIEYTSAVDHDARQSIIDTYGWTINDGGQKTPKLSLQGTYSALDPELNVERIGNLTIGTTSGYAKVTYPDGTFGVIGNGIEYNYYTAAELESSPTYNFEYLIPNSGGTLTVNVVSCDIDGITTGDIRYINVNRGIVDSIDVSALDKLQVLNFSPDTGMTQVNISSLNISGLNDLIGLNCVNSLLDYNDVNAILLQLESNGRTDGHFSGPERSSASLPSYSHLIDSGWHIDCPIATATPITFTKANYGTNVDVVSQYVTLKRGDNQGLFNTNEGSTYGGVVFGGVKHLWIPYNDIIADDAWTKFDISSVNVSSLVYTGSTTPGTGGGKNSSTTLISEFFSNKPMVPWEIAIQSNPLDVLNKEMIMLDVQDGKFYQVKFTQWTSGGNGGGLSYTRALIL